jgi:hypothetical protein
MKKKAREAKASKAQKGIKKGKTQRAKAARGT